MSFIEEDMRLCLLLLLHKADGGTLNNVVLQTGLRRRGHRAGLDKLAGELNWLSARGLVTLEAVETSLVAGITWRGRDVARGDTEYPGVKMPVLGFD